jgi:hypothetical protein
MSRLLVAIPKVNPPALGGPHGHRAGCVHLGGRRVLVHPRLSFDVKNLVLGVLGQDRRRKGVKVTVHRYAFLPFPSAPQRICLVLGATRAAQGDSRPPEGDGKARTACATCVRTLFRMTWAAWITGERCNALVLLALSCVGVSLSVSNRGLRDRKVSGRQQMSIKEARGLPARHDHAR